MVETLMVFCEVPMARPARIELTQCKVWEVEFWWFPQGTQAQLFVAIWDSVVQNTTIPYRYRESLKLSDSD